MQITQVKYKQAIEKAVSDLQNLLVRQDLDYLLVDQVSDKHVSVKFLGQFKQQTVVWDAVIRTLSDYYEAELKGLTDHSVELKQFIDIEKKDTCYKIMLVLNLNKIDRAAIQKSIIMVRQYKRLDIGRHEYGAAHCFDNRAS